MLQPLLSKQVIGTPIYRDSFILSDIESIYFYIFTIFKSCDDTIRVNLIYVKV